MVQLRWTSADGLHKRSELKSVWETVAGNLVMAHGFIMYSSTMTSELSLHNVLSSKHPYSGHWIDDTFGSRIWPHWWRVCPICRLRHHLWIKTSDHAFLPWILVTPATPLGTGLLSNIWCFSTCSLYILCSTCRWEGEWYSSQEVHTHPSWLLRSQMHDRSLQACHCLSQQSKIVSYGWCWQQISMLTRKFNAISWTLYLTITELLDL